MAILANNTLNAVIINSNGITLGSTVTGIEDLGGSLNNASGSYVRISGNGITLNSQANLIVDTTNVKINAKSSPYFKVSKDANNYIECTSSGLTVKGDITANNLTLAGGATISGLTSIAGWSVGANRLYSGSGTSYVGLDSGTADESYAIWCGGNSSSNAPFKVNRDGSVYLTKLVTREKYYDSSGTARYRDKTINFSGDDDDNRLSGATITGWSTSKGELYTTYGTVNFNSAASLQGYWDGNVYKVKNKNTGTVLVSSPAIGIGFHNNGGQGPYVQATYSDGSGNQNYLTNTSKVVSLAFSSSTYTSATKIKVNVGTSGITMDNFSLFNYWRAAYEAGWNDCRNEMIENQY
jgi:hypothetical protein